MAVPPAPPDLDARELWFNVEPITPDQWRHQRSANWLRAERIQGAFNAGRKEMSEDLFQARWEQQRREKQQAERQAAERAVHDGARR